MVGIAFHQCFYTLLKTQINDSDPIERFHESVSFSRCSRLKQFNEMSYLFAYEVVPAGWR